MTFLSTLKESKLFYSCLLWSTQSGWPQLSHCFVPGAAPHWVFSRSVNCLPITNILFFLLLYCSRHETKLTHRWHGGMSQGQPGWQRSSASPSWGDEDGVPGNRMTTAAGSQLCVLLSLLAWVPLLQIPLLTAGGVQPLWDMLYCDALRQIYSANRQLLALEEQGECSFLFLFFYALWMRCNLFF